MLTDDRRQTTDNRQQTNRLLYPLLRMRARGVKINNIITKYLIIVTVSIGWEALTTNLNKRASKKNRDRIGSLRNNINAHDANNEVYSFFALKGKCRS